jgi:hypothetical protein
MKDLKEIVEALRKSKYGCVAGDLINCVEFIELEKKANDTDSFCCLGPDHSCMLNVNGGYCAADVCQYKVNQIQ